MRDRNACIASLALVVLASAATAACATAETPARASGQKEPLVAREVVVQVKADGRGGVVVTPDRAIVRTGQKLVIAVCCEELKITWKRPEPRVPEPACGGGECTLVGPEVKEPVTVDYNVLGTCGGKPFKLDPRFIFIP
jgi:hypothetical protein